MGLLTGDNSINADAPVVVMTTEVLRNMIYGRSPALHGLGVVVLDEVHFLQDTYRGPVWEEVIIHLPPAVRLVCLSATVSNAEELAAWMTTVRGPTAAVIEERRPVSLESLYLIGDRTAERLHLLPTLVDGRPNPEAHGSTARRCAASAAPAAPRPAEALHAGPAGGAGPARGSVDAAGHHVHLQPQRLRRGRPLRDRGGLRLTTGAERDRIREIVDEHVAALDERDLAVLGYGPFLAGLEAGVAAHHAG